MNQRLYLHRADNHHSMLVDSKANGKKHPVASTKS